MHGHTVRANTHIQQSAKAHTVQASGRLRVKGEPITALEIIGRLYPVIYLATGLFFRSYPRSVFCWVVVFRTH